MSDPVIYTPELEHTLEDEAQIAADLREAMLSISRKTDADGFHGLRSVHAKSHALLTGELEVDANLPPYLAQGLFGHVKTYPVIMRFSTTPGDILPDSVSTPRGLAIKVVGVQGARLPGTENDVTQDFVMINGPAFQTSNAKSFLNSLKLLAATTDKAEGAKVALSAVMRGTEKVIETFGGQNAMIVDSSALPEQVVKDALYSGFYSAGQRCSALRVLFLQEEIADKTIELLKGAMRELRIGDPAALATDVGPVIDEAARARLEAHAGEMQNTGKVIQRLSLPAVCQYGTFFAPLAVEIAGLEQLQQEHFGPILHVARFPGRRLDGVIESINNSRYGLTLGVHSRIETTWRRVQSQARVGNC